MIYKLNMRFNKLKEELLNDTKSLFENITDLHQRRIKTLMIVIFNETSFLISNKFYSDNELSNILKSQREAIDSLLSFYNYYPTLTDIIYKTYIDILIEIKHISLDYELYETTQNIEIFLNKLEKTFIYSIYTN